MLRRRTSVLHASQWEAIGFGASGISLANAANGDLIIGRAGGTNGQVGIRYKPRSAIANVRVKARVLMSGWESLVDQQRVGPAARLNGTLNTSDWSGYFFRPQRIATSDNIQFRAMQYVGGAHNNVAGSTSYGSSSSWFGAVWDMEFAVDGSTIYTSVLRGGDAATKVEQTNTSTDVTAAGSVGIFGFNIPDGFEVRMSAFSVEAISTASTTPMATTEPAPGSFSVSSTTSPESGSVLAASGSFEVS